MPLPKIKHPLFDVTVPSTKKKIKLRPMLAKEDKILLIAKESDDDADIFNSIKQVVNNCIMDEVDIDTLSIFDLEYLYLKIRSVSVDNMIRLTFRDNEDEQTYDFEIDLSKIEVEFPPKIEKKIMVDETTGILMKYPPAELYGNKDFFHMDDPTAKMEKLIKMSIDKIFDEDQVYQVKDASEKEIQEFMDSLPLNAVDKINEFMVNQPTIRHELSYTNKNGKIVNIVLNTLNDFFTLR